MRAVMWFTYAPTVHRNVPCFSASQIETFLQCARKWAFKYIEGVETPAHPNALLGSRVHKQLETHLKGGSFTFVHEDGTVDESGAIAQAALGHIPDPLSPGLVVEGSFVVQSLRTGFLYQGFKDVEMPGLVHDHKSTGNLRYAKTSDDLLWDTQAILYAQDHLDFYGTDLVRLRWLYLPTKGSKVARPVEVEVTREHAAQVMPVIEGVAHELTELHRAKPAALSLPPNANACEAFGGCPHRSRCNLSPAERLKSVMSGSFLSSLQARKDVVAPKAPAPVEDDAPPALDPVPINPPESALPPCPVPEEAGAPEAPAEKPKRTTKKAEKVTPVQAGVGAFALYVDCEPVRGRSVTRLSTLVEQARGIIKADPETGGVEDFRFIGYGKGPGVLSLAVAKLAEEHDAITLSTRTPEGSACLAALESRAAYVVVGH
jgi:hypothetical protein